MDERRRALIGLHIGVFLMGASGLFAKLVSTSAFFIVFGRVMFAAAALALLIKLRGGVILPRCTHRDIAGFVVLGLLMAFHWFAFFYSIQLSSVAIGLLTFSTFPIFTIFLEPVFFRTALVLRDFAIAGLCCLGVWFVAPDFTVSSSDALGVLWGILGGFSYALMLLLNKNYVARYSPVQLTFYQCFVAMVVLLPVVLWRWEPVLLLDWGYLFVHGVVCTALAFTLFVSAARYIAAGTISILTMLEVLYGIVLAYFILGEGLDVEMAFGGGLIIVAAYLAMRRGV